MLADIFPFGYEFHLEVWMLILVIIALGGYIAKILANKLDMKSKITKRQKWSFVAGVFVLWLASDWPMHDISESYLYSVHMIQHLLIAFIVPPLFLIATPRWLANLVIGINPLAGSNSAAASNPGAASSSNMNGGNSIPDTNGAILGTDSLHNSALPKWLRRLAHPVLAGLLFNAIVAASHIPWVVNQSVESAGLHYLVHLLVFVTGIIMWLPVCGPFEELRLNPPGQMIYLFTMSLLPTIPAAFLTFANGPIYEAYEVPTRLWGIGVVADQQAAGLVMKLVGGFYLWGIIGYIFFKWTLREEKSQAQQRLMRSQKETLQPFAGNQLLHQADGQADGDREQSRVHSPGIG